MIAGWTIFFIIVYILHLSGFELICKSISFGYPTYASINSIRTPSQFEVTKWLIYWIVFSCFSIFDFFTSSFMQIIPLYWLLKMMFLFYLALPQTDGSIKLFNAFIEPGFSKIESLLKQKT